MIQSTTYIHSVWYEVNCVSCGCDGWKCGVFDVLHSVAKVDIGAGRDGLSVTLHYYCITYNFVVNPNLHNWYV